MDLVEKIQSLCEQKNTTIAQLERNLDFSKGSIRKWSNSSPSSDKLLKVARYFDVSMESLLDNSNIRLSTPYRLINKMIQTTLSNHLTWQSFASLDSNPDITCHPSGSDLFKLHSFKEYSSENFSFNPSDAFFAYYQRGGYAIIKIDDKNKDESIYAFFILCNDIYFLYITDKVLQLVGTLFEAAKSKAMGVNDFINDFLNDNFGEKQDPDPTIDDDIPYDNLSL